MCFVLSGGCLEFYSCLVWVCVGMCVFCLGLLGVGGCCCDRLFCLGVGGLY